MDGDDEKAFESLLTIWAKGLEGMTQSDIERGLNAVLKSGMEFEPSLPRFVEFCKQPKREAVYHRPLNRMEAHEDHIRLGHLNRRSGDEPGLFVRQLREQIEEKARLKELDADLPRRKNEQLAALKKLVEKQ